MPLSDQQLNQYEQFLKRRSDISRNEQLSRLGNGVTDYGGQSMTSSVNKYNNDRQDDYMNALSKREGLAQTWQQVANQRALTSGQIGNMTAENQSRFATSALEQGKAIEESRQAQQQHQIDLNKQQLEQERFRAAERHAAESNYLNATQMRLNHQHQNRQIDLNTYIATSNHLLRHHGLALDAQRVADSHNDMREFLNDRGHITNPDAALRWYAAAQADNDDILSRGRGGTLSEAQRNREREERRAQIFQRLIDMDAQEKAQIFHSIEGIAMPLMFAGDR
jgi:hypothetical protein